MLVTKQLPVAIDLYGMEKILWKSMATGKCFLCSEEERNSFRLRMSKRWYNFHFRVNYLLNIYSNISYPMIRASVRLFETSKPPLSLSRYEKSTTVHWNVLITQCARVEHIEKSSKLFVLNGDIKRCMSIKLINHTVKCVIGCTVNISHKWTSQS